MPTTQAPISVLLTGEDSGGHLGVIDEYVAADFDGPPLHRHPWFDEAFYVLEGELTFLADEVTTLGPGELAFAARGQAHTFANHGGARARVLIAVTPAGFERYFLRVAAEHAGEPPPPEPPGARPFTEIIGPQIPRLPGREG